MRRPPLHIFLALVAAVVFTATTGAAAVTSPPVINRAHVDPITGYLVIQGAGFTPSPTVSLSGLGLTVITATDSEIFALLPLGLEPGTYLLGVHVIRKDSNPFEMTIG